MEKGRFMGVSDVQELLGVSRSTAYRLIKTLNEELNEKGYITISGKVSTRYLMERIYGLKEPFEV